MRSRKSRGVAATAAVEAGAEEAAPEMTEAAHAVVAEEAHAVMAAHVAVGRAIRGRLRCREAVEDNDRPEAVTGPATEPA
jgi:hypothetical protein